MTPFSAKVLAILAASRGGRGPEALARELWPDSPAWRFPNQVGIMAARATRSLLQLQDEGYVVYAGMLWSITLDGRQALALAEGKVRG